MRNVLMRLLLDLLVPPRASERLVRGLMLEDLLNMQTTEGLPYHNDAVRALVWEIKYFANPRAAALAGALLAEEVTLLAGEDIGTPLMLPVPMHASRRKTRGHNQTELLCKAMVRVLGDAVTYRHNLLTRVVDTPTQQGLERAKRLKNVKGSMCADTAVAGRVCIVVDDVTTTGATLAEAKRALRAAGARSVHCVALAYS